MALPATLALMAAALAVYVAALSLRFAAAPGWRDQHWFSLVAVSAAGYAAFDIATAVNAPAPAVLFCSRIQLLCAVIQALAWKEYADVNLGRRPRRWEKAFSRTFLAAGLSALVPGVVYGDRVSTHRFAPLGLTYTDAVPNLYGNLLFAAVLATYVVVSLQYVAAWRRGHPYAAVHCVSVVVLLVLGTNDALTASGFLSSPYLGDIGFIIPVCAVGYSLTSRFASDARDLARLRAELEGLVAERTRELSKAEEALHRSETLASLGQFAAGVAHEINNPAAVVTGNLHYLSEALEQEERLPADGVACLTDSLKAMNRIARIVRQLLDASRVASAPNLADSVVVHGAVRESVRTAQARCGARVAFEVLVPPELRVAANETMLVQVLVNLIVNGAQAVAGDRTDGRVAVRAARVDGRVQIAVEDNGCGMSEEVLRRVFEPFFTTKPFGGGTGLGLAVSRGLIASLGGSLRLESAEGRGTKATVELPVGAPAEPLAAPAHRPAAPAGPRRSLLVVDDEPAVLASLCRLLADRYLVSAASSGAEALELLAQDRFDLVLCDLMMPDGGGERVYRELVASQPGTAARFVFLTGGATTDAARAFLASQPQPVLDKPVDLAALAALAARLVPTDAAVSA